MFWRSKSYEVLPVLSVRGDHLRATMRTVTVAWMFGIIWMSCITGSRITIFGRMLGFNNLHFGILAATPFLARFGQMFATILIERTGLRKYQFIYFMLIQRIVWLAVAAVPLISLVPGVPPLPAEWAVAGVLALLMTAAVSESFGAPAWLTWMGDMIPRRIRGRYFASRSRWSAGVRIPVVIGLAIYLDWATVPDAPITPDAQPLLLWSICVILALAALSGMTDILMFERVREVVRTTPHLPRRPAVQIDLPGPRGQGAFAWATYPARYALAAGREVLVGPLRDRTFRRYVLFGATATFAMTVSGPFCWRHCLETLHFSQLATDGLFMVVGPVVGMLAVRRWGRLLDAWGRRPVLMLGAGLACFSLAPYFLSSPQTPSPTVLIDWVNRTANTLSVLVGLGPARLIGPDWPVGAWLVMSCSLILGSIGWNGVMLAQGNIVLGFSDGPGRSKYVAAFAMLVGLGGIAGGWVGGAVAEALVAWQDDPVHLAGGLFQWNNWHATFAISVLARLIAFAQTWNMPDPGSRRMSDLWRLVSANVWNYVQPRLTRFRRPFGPISADRHDRRRKSA